VSGPAPTVALFALRTGAVSDTLVGEARAILDDGERARAARFRHAHDARQHVLASALTRRALASLVGGGDALAARIAFGFGERGRPFVRSPAALADVSFNASRTAGLVVCAISSTHTIGVDVENLARAIDVDEIAPVALHPSETRALSRLDAPARRLAFLRVWTLKEAYAKARGLGLYLPVERAAFEVDDAARVSARFEPDLDDDPSAWCFTLHGPSAIHQVAIAHALPSSSTPTVSVSDALPLFSRGARLVSLSPLDPEVPHVRT